MNRAMFIRLLIAVLFLISGCGASVFKFQPVDLNALNQDRQRVPQLLKKYPEERAVFLHRESTLEHSVVFSSGHWSARMNNIRRYVVIDPTHEPLTTFKYIAYKGWEISKADIIILSPDGKEQRFGVKDLIEEKSPGGRKTYKLAYPKVSKGTLIEQRIEVLCAHPIHAGGIFNGSTPLRFSHPAERVVAAISYPKNWSVIIKRVAAKKPRKLSVYESGGNRVISAVRTQVPPLPEEKYSPYRDEDGDYMRFYINYARAPSLVYYGSGSWKARGEKIKKYWMENDATFSGVVTDKARQVTRGASSDLERFKKIVEYVQREIQSDGEYKEKNFADVLKTKRGKSWQVTGLAHQMARKVGLEVKYLMIHSADDGYFDKEFTSIFEPGDPALQVTIEGKAHFGFPSRKWLPIDTFLKWHQDRPAYRIGPKGFEEFMTLPIHSHDHRSVESKVTVEVGKDGTLQVNEVVTYHGVRAFEERSDLADLKESKLQEKLKGDLLKIQGDVEIKSVRVVGLKELYQPLEKHYSYRIGNALSLSSDRAILQTAGLFSSRVRKKDTITRKSRVRPIVSYADSKYRREVTFNLPDGWDLGDEPPPLKFNNRCGEVGMEYHVSTPGILKVTKHVRTNRFQFPADEYADLKKFLDARDKAVIPSLIFKTK